MNCQTCRAEIEELEAGAPLSERARAHVRVCPECWAFHDERQALRRLVGSLGPIAAPPDFDFRLRARLAAAKTSSGNGRATWLSFLSSVPAISLAATFALLVAGFVIYKQMQPRPSVNETVARETEQGNTVKDSSQPAEVAPTVTPLRAMNENPPEITFSSPPRVVVKNSPRRNVISQSVARAPQIVSNDSAALAAKETTPERGQPVGEVVQLTVRPASQPVRVSLDDKSGARRTVTLEPVVFGSQDLAGRSFSRASAPQDIW